MAGPEIRASFLKYMVSFSRKAEAGHNIATAIEPHRDAIREAPLLGWLPAEILLDVCESVGRLLGEHEATPFWRDAMLAATDRALMGPVLEAPMRIHGPTLAAISRSAPQVWALVTRRCGVAMADLGEGLLTVAYRELPTKFVKSRPFAWFLMGSCQANAAIVGVPVEVKGDVRESVIFITLRKAGEP